MTLTVAFASRDWALIASDTRAVRWSGGGGFDDDARPELKISRVSGGFCAGGGWTTPREVAVAALRARADLRRPDTVLDALRDCRPAIAHMLDGLEGREAPGLTGLVTGSLRAACATTAKLVTVSDAGEGFVARYYDLPSAACEYEVADQVVSGFAPAGLEAADLRPVLKGLAFSFGLFHPDVHGAIRMLACAFVDVRKLFRGEPSMSASVTFGVLERDADGVIRATRVRPVVATSFLQTSDAYVRRLLEASAEPAPLEEPWT